MEPSRTSWAWDSDQGKEWDPSVKNAEFFILWDCNWRTNYGKKGNQMVTYSMVEKRKGSQRSWKRALIAKRETCKYCCRANFPIWLSN